MTCSDCSDDFGSKCVSSGCINGSIYDSVKMKCQCDLALGYVDISTNGVQECSLPWSNCLARNCRSCSSTQCLSCDGSNQEYSNLFNGQCIENCRAYTYWKSMPLINSGGICQNCPLNCVTCGNEKPQEICHLGFIKENVQPFFPVEPQLIFNVPLKYSIQQAEAQDSSRPNTVIFDFKAT